MLYYFKNECKLSQKNFFSNLKKNKNKIKIKIKNKKIHSSINIYQKEMKYNEYL
jgi:Sec7-like guanine-nucleotide exchange factor